MSNGLKGLRSPMKNLNIAFLLDNGPSNWRTQEEFHFRLSRALVARGATPVLVYSGKLSEDVLSRMRDSGAEVITEARLQGMRHYYRVLASTFKRCDTNLVHVRWFVYYSIVPWLVRSRSVRRVVYTEANSWLPSERGKWSWKTQLNRLRTKAACRPITQFIAVSQFIRDGLVRSGVNANRIRVVYNGVNVDRFVPDPEAQIAWRSDYGIAADEVVISTVNRLHPYKDVKTIVLAFGELVKRGVPARLFVAGSGPLESDLKTLSGQLGLTDRIHWLGHLEDPLPLLQGSDIFTLASRGEAYACALVEAMACGIPSVGSRCGGNSEAVEEGRTGLLATPGDPSSFADAYERLAQDINLRQAMGQQSLDRAQRLFSVDRAVEETIGVYEKLLV